VGTPDWPAERTVVSWTTLLPRTEWPKREQVALCRVDGCNTPALLGDELRLCADCGQFQRLPGMARVRRDRYRRVAAVLNEPDGTGPACSGRTDLFFSDDPDVIAEAKAICADCPVRPECLEVAFATPALVGVWGGLTEEERASLRNQPRRSAT